MDLQIRITWRFYLASVRIAKSNKNKWQLMQSWRGARGTLIHCWCSCKLTQTLEISVAAPRKLTVDLPEDPAIPLSGITGIYPKDASSHLRDTCSNMFIAVLVIKARNRKQHRCPSTDEWKKENVIHLYNRILLSNLKIKWNSQVNGWN